MFFFDILQVAVKFGIVFKNLKTFGGITFAKLYDDEYSTL
jgi:hypothetical protein